MQPYRVHAKVQNNRLWRAVLERFPDVTSQSDAAARVGLTASAFGALLNMKVFPARLKDGRYRYSRQARRLADSLAQDVEYLFDPKLYAGQVPPTVTVEVGLAALTRRTTRELPPNPEDVAMTAEQNAMLRQTLDQLTPREALIIRKRFGIDGDEHTLDEVGLLLSLSRERVREIEARALEKLRHPKLSKPLRLLRH